MTGTRFTVPRNESLPANEVPLRGTGVGSVVVVVATELDPGTWATDPTCVELVGPDWLEEQALAARITASRATNVALGEARRRLDLPGDLPGGGGAMGDLTAGGGGGGGATGDLQGGGGGGA